MTMPRGVLFDIANKKRQPLANCVVQNHIGCTSAVLDTVFFDKTRLIIRSGLLWSLDLCRYRVFAARGREDLSFQFDEWLAANPLPGASSPLFRHGILERLPDGKEISSKVALEDVLKEEDELGLHGLWMDQLSLEGKRAMVRVPVLNHDGIWWEEHENGAVHGKFSWRDTADIFYECLRECGQMVWHNKRKCFMQVNSKAGTKPLVFVPPTIQLPMRAPCTASEYLKLLRDSEDGLEKRRFLLALVSSSAAALGVFEDDALVLHKVITAYTIRAKQGKAQLHHLRQGGAGRMSIGAGIRARESERLFSRICEKLGEWEKEIEGSKFLYYSGNMRVWNEVYACNAPKLFVARDDIRWHKVPYSVRQPRLRELQRVYYGLSPGAVSYGVS